MISWLSLKPAWLNKSIGINLITLKHFAQPNIIVRISSTEGGWGGIRFGNRNGGSVIVKLPQRTGKVTKVVAIVLNSYYCTLPGQIKKPDSSYTVGPLASQNFLQNPC